MKTFGEYIIEQNKTLGTFKWLLENTEPDPQGEIWNGLIKSGWKKDTEKFLKMKVKELRVAGAFSNGDRNITVEWDDRQRYLIVSLGFEEIFDFDCRTYYNNPQEAVKVFNTDLKKRLKTIKGN